METPCVDERVLFFRSSGRGVRVHAGRSEGGRKPLRCRGFSGSVVADSGSAAGSRSRIGEEGDALVLIASIHFRPLLNQTFDISPIADFRDFLLFNLSIYVRGVVVRAPFWEPLPKKRKKGETSASSRDDVSSIPSQQHAHDVRAPVLQPRPFLQQTADCTGVGATKGPCKCDGTQNRNIRPAVYGSLDCNSFECSTYMMHTSPY